MPRTKQFDEDAVLEKVTALFRKKGFNGTSMDELVQATGLSRSSLYDSFGDKHALYLRTLREYSSKTVDDIDAALTGIRSPKKKIESIFHETARQIVQRQSDNGCLIVNATTELAINDKQVASLACSNMEAMETLFYELVKEGQAKGEIGKKHRARSLARFLFCTISGLRVVGQTRPDKGILEDIVRAALSVLD